MTTTPASLLLPVFAIGAAPEAASLSVPRDESAAQPASAPAAFVASRLLGSTAPAELLWTKSGCIPSFTHRRRRPTAMGSQMGILDGLKEALRGGGPFRRETNAAKYRNRPRLGIDISNRMATALSALSVALVAGATALALPSRFETSAYRKPCCHSPESYPRAAAHGAHRMASACCTNAAMGLLHVMANMKGSSTLRRRSSSVLEVIFFAYGDDSRTHDAKSTSVVKVGTFCNGAALYTESDSK